MRASMAYFAGAGTVIAAIAGGVGGGLLIADMVSPKSPKQGAELTRLERRVSPAPIPAANAPTEPVQYLGASQLPPSGAAAAEAVPAQAQTQADNSASKPSQPVDTVAAPQPAAQAPQPATPAPQPAASAAQPAASAAQPVAHEQTAVADDTVARPRDADLRRSVEKRRAERHQQWADKRRHQQRQGRELQAVEEKVREETEPRQEFAPEPERVTRVIRLFGPE
jgi:hypothetical protein